MCHSGDAAKDYLQREVEILRTKTHWKKAYFYLWDEVFMLFSRPNAIHTLSIISVLCLDRGLSII